MMSGKSRFRGQTGQEKTEELLSAYLDGALTVDEQAALEARLQKDLALAQRLQRLRLTVNALADLPQVGVPRNFILSPGMVAPPRSAVQPRQRRLWPVFGWATAAATLLFFLAFAGDAFFAVPTPLPPTTRIAATAPETLAERSEERAAPAAPVELAMSPAPAESQIERETDKEVVVVPESTAALASEAQPAPDTGEAESATADDGSPMAPAMMELPAEGHAESDSAVAEEALLEKAPSASVPRAATEEAVLGAQTAAPTSGGGSQAPSPEPTPSAVAGADVALVTATPDELSEAAGEGVAQTLIEGNPTPASGVVPIVPLALTPEPSASDKATRELLSWLRVAEIGLGMSVLVFGAVTLILRRRGR